MVIGLVADEELRSTYGSYYSMYFEGISKTAGTDLLNGVKERYDSYVDAISGDGDSMVQMMKVGKVFAGHCGLPDDTSLIGVGSTSFVEMHAVTREILELAKIVQFNNFLKGGKNA